MTRHFSPSIDRFLSYNSDHVPAFAEAERDGIRERIGQVKADQKARGRYLGGKVPFGFRIGESGDLVEGRKRAHNADEIMAEIVARRLVAHLERAGFVVMKRQAKVGAAALGRGFEK